MFLTREKISIFFFPWNCDGHQIPGLEGKLPRHLARIILIIANELAGKHTLSQTNRSKLPHSTLEFEPVLSFSHSTEQGEANISENYFKHFMTLASFQGEVSR